MFSHFGYTLRGANLPLFQNGQHAMSAYTISVQGQSIRTDWINKIQREKEQGVLTCTIWFSVGPVSLYTFKGKNAEIALQLLAGHPALPA
jgi:hypothetical protein